jgi:hypothetical protein
MAPLMTMLSNPKRNPPIMETLAEINRFHRKRLEGITKS